MIYKNIHMNLVRSLICIFVILNFLSSCKSGSDNEKKTDAKNDSIIEKINSPELKELNKKILDDPNNAALYNERAQLYIKLKQLDLAMGDANRALKIDSTKAEFYITFADVNFALNKTRQAKETLEKAVKKFPENTEGLLKLGELFFLVRQYENALTHINKALKLDENLAKAYYLKGSVFKEMGDTAKAISSMQTATEQDNRYFDAFLDIGMLYASRKNPMAFEYYDNALRLRPTDVNVMYAKAKLMQDLDRIEDAELLYDKLLNINPNNEQVLYNLGAITLDKKKDAVKAIDYFSKAITIAPNYTEAYFARGVCYELLKDVNNATADYKMCLQITPNYELAVEALNGLAKK